jgi:uncharacterized protein YjbI with pentapeptide repeats
MSARWTVKPPAAGAPTTEPIRVDPAEPTLRGVHIAGQRLSGAEPVDGLEVDDVVLTDCDLAGLVADRARARRLRISGGRLRGVTWTGSLIDDVSIEGVTAADVAVRFSTLRRTVIVDSVLPGLDLTESTFDRVRFERCDLRGARFDHCRVQELRIEGCDLSGATGVEALRGASVHPDDAGSMALSLAAAVGLRVQEAPD